MSRTLLLICYYFLLHFKECFLLDQRAVSLNFWALKKLWTWSAFFYHMPESLSFFQFSSVLTLQSFPVGNGDLSKAFRLLQSHRAEPVLPWQPGRRAVFHRWKAVRAFPRSGHFRGCLEGSDGACMYAPKPQCFSLRVKWMPTWVPKRGILPAQREFWRYLSCGTFGVPSTKGWALGGSWGWLFCTVVLLAPWAPAVTWESQHSGLHPQLLSLPLSPRCWR